MMQHDQIKKHELAKQIKNGNITLAGNSNLKIYGTLQCRSGKRMQKKSRVFFKNKTEAMKLGYRPCGHCMRKAHRKWKSSLIVLG